MKAVNDRALLWLHSRGRPAAEVTAVKGQGSDWAGSTEDGFHSTFDMTLEWVDVKGTERREWLEGQDLSDFWDFIVADEAPA